MASTWLESSERACGLVLTKKISHTLVRPEQFEHPYNDIIKQVIEGDKFEDIYLNYSGAVDAALMAVEHVNGHHNLDFLEILDKSRTLYTSGDTLSKLSHKMLNGENIDLSRIRDVLNNLDQGKTGRIFLDQIEPSETPFLETGWEAYDEHLMGLPEVGLIVVSGNPSVGKTSWAIKLASCFVKRHKEKKVAFYSLEMIESEIALRFNDIDNSQSYKKNVIINCDPIKTDELINDAAQIEDLGLVIIDFADYLVSGDISDSSMGYVYVALARATKRLKCPIVLLAQYSYKYEGGIPRPYHIRYTSLAQILAWTLICLWNPNLDYYAHDEKSAEILPIRPGHAYAIVWKMRGGFKKHMNDNPGAILHQFKGSHGWSPKGKWFHIVKS